MNYGKYFVMLMAAFILIIPAFSASDDGHAMVGQDGQKKTFDENSMMGADGQHQFGPKSMMESESKEVVCLTVCKIEEKDGQPDVGPKSMMGDQGRDGKDNTCPFINTCGCQNTMKGEQGQEGKQWTCGNQDGQPDVGPKSMMGDQGRDGKDNTCPFINTCGCQNTMKVEQGQDGKQWTCGNQEGQPDVGPKSMMGDQGRDGKDNTCPFINTCGCQNSMKGEQGQGNK